MEKMVWWDNRYLHSMPAKILTIYMYGQFDEYY